MALIHIRNGRRTFLVLGVTVLSLLAGSCSGGSSSSSQARQTTDVSVPGDIPDSQVFVPFRPPAARYSLVVPEGWASTTSARGTSFSDHFNSIDLASSASATSPTATSVRTIDVPMLRRTQAGFHLVGVDSLTRGGVPVVRTRYRALSAPDPVTGKRVSLEVEQYEYWHNGTRLTMTLSAPIGSDNVDPWRRITDSLRWQA